MFILTFLIIRARNCLNTWINLSLFYITLILQNFLLLTKRYCKFIVYIYNLKNFAKQQSKDKVCAIVKTHWIYHENFELNCFEYWIVLKPKDF